MFTSEIMTLGVDPAENSGLRQQTRQYRLRVTPDIMPENPREMGDMLGTMVCWHGRYILGDEQPSDSPDEYLLALAEEFEEGLADKLETYADNLWEAIDENPEYPSIEKKLLAHGDMVGEYEAELVDAALEDRVIRLPLYLFDHSGISMSTGAFGCPWDSGQVGFVYARLEHAQAMLGTDNPEAIADALRAEVQEYDTYLRGDVWCFELESRPAAVTDEFGDDELWSTEGACCGFYGPADEPDENGMAENIEDKFRPLLDTLEMDR